MTVLAVLVTIALVVTWWWRWSSRNGCGRLSCPSCHGRRRLPRRAVVTQKLFDVIVNSGPPPRFLLRWMARLFFRVDGNS